MGDRYQRAREDVYNPQWHRRSAKADREMVYANEFRRRRFRNRARQVVYDQQRSMSGAGCVRLLAGAVGLLIAYCLISALL